MLFYSRQDNEYVEMGKECVNKAYDILQSTDWKVEKVAKNGDTIYSINREKMGKIYKLTVSINQLFFSLLP